MATLNYTTWTQTYDGVEVTFFLLQLPNSKTFQGRWLAWFESDLYDHMPREYEVEPSLSTIEQLYTG